MSVANKSNSIVALVVAAGRGARFGGTVPKQYLSLHGEPLLAQTLKALLACQNIDHVLCVIHPDDQALYEDTLSPIALDVREKLLAPVHGGDTRQETVYRGLCALKILSPKHVLIHDGARPFVSQQLMKRVIDGLSAFNAVIPVLPMTDTVKHIDDTGMICENVSRDHLVTVQTPQGFAFQTIYAAHEAVKQQGLRHFTDDSAIITHQGGQVMSVVGEPDNIKVTTQDDVRHMRQRNPRITRVGMGYDVHAFGEGDHVWLGGVKIAHTHGVVAHSDGDVILHALTDALLGTIAAGDIGTHFPPSDPQWRGASSDQFVQHACRLVREAGGVIINVDITLICEQPKVGTCRERIVTRISEMIGLSVKRVSLKATTSEKLGFTGRREGLAAHAIVSVSFPDDD